MQYKTAENRGDVFSTGAGVAAHLHGVVTRRAVLRYHGEWGVEAKILRNGELVIGRRFDTKAQAMQRGNWSGRS